MIVNGNTLISEDITESYFLCDLAKCKGACCVEGDLGAPLEEGELAILERIYERVKPFLTKAGINAIEKQGKYILDREGEYSTPTVDGKECAYVVNEKGVLRCGIEKAYEAGETDFKKPISCHLYPVRVTRQKDYDALNYDEWHICSSACKLGAEHKVPLFRFVKDALVRKYGREWYEKLVELLEGRILTNSPQDH